MKIVLDTNIICQDFRLNGNHFRIFLDGFERIPGTLHIPEIVIDEATVKYVERLEGLLREADRTSSDLKRHLACSIQTLTLDPQEEGKKYRQFLEEIVTKYSVEILPYPDVPHKRVVERALQRKKPFQRNRTGYRDFLIWHCVTRLALSGTEQIGFVTSDKRAFGPGPELPEELKPDVIVNPDRFRLYSSLKALNEHLIIPKLKRSEEIKQLLQKEHLADFDLYKWTENEILTLIQEYDLGGELVGFQRGVGFASPSSVEKIGDLTVLDVKELGSGDKVITASIDVELVVSVDVDRDDYLNSEEVREFFGEDGDFLNASVQTLVEAEIRFSVIVEKDTYEVQWCELEHIDGTYGSIQL